MKRTHIDLETIANRQNLALAAYKAARGKAKKPVIVDFFNDFDNALQTLGDSIRNGTTSLEPLHRFIIHDPKVREISAASFQDRVLHHAIMNIAGPRFDALQAHGSYACRINKGVHRALLDIQTGLRTCKWFGQVDIRSYFPSIEHDKLSRHLARIFKGQAFLALIDRILLQGAVTTGKGLPIGSLTSQYFANAYLSLSDQFLMDCPSVFKVVRYMDDIVWFCQTREQAFTTMAQLEEFLTQSLALSVKTSKRVGPSKEGIRFCGYRVKPGVILAGTRKLSRYRKAVRMLTKEERSETKENLLKRAHNSHFAALLPSQTLHFRQRLWQANTL
jgi:RNA-directed DNA polymerase